MKVLFVSDRYPPDVVGGAEISLSHLVNELKNREGIEPCVLALTEKHNEICYEDVDDVPVTRIPSRYDHRFPIPAGPVVAAWAGESQADGNTQRSRLKRRWLHKLDKRIKPPLKKIMPALKAHIRYLFIKTRAPFWIKLALFFSNCVCYFLSRENIECLDEDFDQIIDTSALRHEIQRAEPDVVHADNLRSILRYAELELPYKSVALVRDLKFVCPRRVVIGHVGDTPCEMCRMSCVKEVPWIIRPYLKRVFNRNLAYRWRLLNRYDRVITTSRFLQDQMAQGGIEACIVPNPVGDMDALHRAKQKPVKRFDGPTVVSVGMLQKHKGIDYVIRIMPEVRRQFQKARLLIAGRGGYEPELRRIVEKNQASSYIQFVGFISGEELYDLYLQGDVVVCFTRWPEPFGRVPLESMYFERPVVAARHGGFLETIVDEQTGLLVAPGDESALLDAVCRLLADDEMRKRMGKRGYERVLSHYSPTITADCMAEQYAQVVADESTNRLTRLDAAKDSR